MKGVSEKYQYNFSGKYQSYWKPVTSKVEEEGATDALKVFGAKSECLLSYLANGQMTVNEAEEYFHYINDFLQKDS